MECATDDDVVGAGWADAGNGCGELEDGHDGRRGDCEDLGGGEGHGCGEADGDNGACGDDGSDDVEFFNTGGGWECGRDWDEACADERELGCGAYGEGDHVV